MAQQSQQKNYLFYSNQCQHSKRLLQQLQKTSLINTIQMVNIDDPKISVPPFIQCVPSLYIPTSRHVLTESHIFEWIDAQIQQEIKNKGTVNMAEITGDANILPFHQNEMTKGLSGAAYSFLDDSKNDLLNQNYSFLQERDINKMPEYTRYDAPSNGGGDGGGSGMGMNNLAATQRKTGGVIGKAYENLLAARGQDMQQQRGGSPPAPNFSSPY